MTRMVHVKNDRFDASVLYSAQGLVDLGCTGLALAAIEQQERLFMTTTFAARLNEDIRSLLLFDGKPMADAQPAPVFFSMRCTAISAGRCEWFAQIVCDECDGSGRVNTRRYHWVDCPVCADASGILAAVEFVTDLDARFIGWGECPVSCGFSEGVSLSALPEAEALAIVREWYA